MRPAPLPRLPLEPVLLLTRGNIGLLADRVGIDSSQLHRDHRQGGVTPATADRIAVRLGHTPAEIWGDLWWQLPDGACGPTEPRPPETPERKAQKLQAKRAQRQRGREAP